MGKLSAKISFYFVAIVLVLWTSTLTYGFVSSVLPNMHWIVPLFALVVFDAGMLAWLVVFLDYAEGTAQRTIAVLLCVFDFLGVGLMTFAEVFMGGQEFAEVPAFLGESALWGIAVWTIVNVGAILAFHLTSPDARQKMAIRQLRDELFDLSLQKTRDKVEQLADKVSNEQAEALTAEVVGMGRQASEVPAKENLPLTEESVNVEVFAQDKGGNGVVKKVAPTVQAKEIEAQRGETRPLS